MSKRISLRILLISLVLFGGCDVSRDGLSSELETVENIRSITTRFTSHQQDTQSKDSRIVATAEFSPDGSIDKIVQHMTYPYNYKEPIDREFWAEPDTKGLTHLMDGLTLDKAEYNFLYGNNWPVKYAQIAHSNHPMNSKKRLEGKGMQINLQVGAGNWPSEIVMKEEDQSMEVNGKVVDRGMTWFENFESEENKITSYSLSMLIPELMFNMRTKAINERLKSAPDSLKDQYEKMRKAEMERKPSIQENVDYQYDGEKLVRINTKKESYKFYYNENDILIRSEYLKGSVVYNSRQYFYNENGLKTKTEIYNVDGEPEYTIDYEYEFFEI